MFLLQVVGTECFIYKFWPSVLFSSVMGVLLVSIQFMIPLLILVYCYGRILWIIHRRINSNLDQPQTTSTDKFQMAKTNTIKTFLIVGICFVICWSNNQMYFLLFTFGYGASWDGIYYKFTILMIFLNCTVNPFIYLFKYRDYQKALKSCFGCQKLRSDDESARSHGNRSAVNGNYI